MQAAMFQCLLGLECKDFTMIAADQTATKSVFILKNDCEKLITLTNNVIMGVNGDFGDIMQFTNFISNNLALYEMKNNYSLSTDAAVHFTRKSLADSYRNGTPFLMNFLVGGWDEKEGGQLFVMDYLASCVRVPYSAHGFAGMFGISILEYLYNRDMSEAQAYEAIQMCIKEIHQRLFLNLPNFQVKIVSKNGVSSLPIVYAPRIVASPGLTVNGKQNGDNVEKKDTGSGKQEKDEKKKKDAKKKKDIQSHPLLQIENESGEQTTEWT